MAGYALVWEGQFRGLHRSLEARLVNHRRGRAIFALSPRCNPREITDHWSLKKQTTYMTQPPSRTVQAIGTTPKIEKSVAALTTQMCASYLHLWIQRTGAKRPIKQWNRARCRAQLKGGGAVTQALVRAPSTPERGHISFSFDWKGSSENIHPCTKCA